MAAEDNFKNLELKGITSLNRELGRGAYGKVFAVKYCEMICAAKEIHSILVEGVGEDEMHQTIASFLRECHQCSALRHPNIVQFLGIYYPPEGGGVIRRMRLPVMVMEMMADSLTSFVDRYEKIPIQIKFSIVHDVSLGLCYLHNHHPPIVHRDLSPNNVLLTVHHVAKISDLGVAKVIQADSRKTMTKAPGTVDFMPPEALDKSPVYGPSMDVFSFGGIILHIFNQQWPSPSSQVQFDPKSRKMIALSEVERRQEYLDKMTGEAKVLRSLVEECLDYDPVVRPGIATVCKRIHLNKDSCMRDFPQDFIAVYQLSERLKSDNEHSKNEIELQRNTIEDLRTKLEEMEKQPIIIIKKSLLELKETLYYGNDDHWELNMEKLKPRKFLDEEFERHYISVRDNSKKKALAKKLLPTMKAVMQIFEQQKATVYKAVELMETVDLLVQYSYTAEDYDFQLEGRCRRILDQYDSTYKELIVNRSKTDMDQVEIKTRDCLTLLEGSIKAAEEDIAAWRQQRKFEDSLVVLDDVKEKNSMAQDIIQEENDELKLIESHCKEDIKAINRKLGELDAELQKVKVERKMKQQKLNNDLQENCSEQEMLREKLRLLEKEEANKEYETCKQQVKDMQKKIENLLEMTNASIQLMSDMTWCVNKIVETANTEKRRVLQDLEQKELHSNLQLRDALMAKIIFHNMQIEEVIHNLQDTRKETGELNKELKSAVKSGNKHKVARLKEAISSLEGEEKFYEDKRGRHDRELDTLQKKHKEVDKKIYATGITQLPAIDERIAKWKAEQEKCFDDPNTGRFHSNILQL